MFRQHILYTFIFLDIRKIIKERVKISAKNNLKQANNTFNKHNVVSDSILCFTLSVGFYTDYILSLEKEQVTSTKSISLQKQAKQAGITPTSP